MMNKVEITKILVAIEVVIALVIIGLIGRKCLIRFLQ